MLAWFISRESYVGYAYAEQRQSFYKVLDHLPQAEAKLAPTAPIVIPDPLMALTFQHYAPPALAARVVFPVDFPAVRKYRGDDSPDENLWAGRNLIYNLPIVPLATFQRAAGNYLILASDDNWLVQDLRHHDYRVHRLPIDTRAEAIGGFTLIEVPSRQEALQWAARVAAACRCAQEVWEFGADPELDAMFREASAS